MRTKIKEIELFCNEKILDISFSNVSRDIIFGITSSSCILIISIEEKKVLKKINLPFSKINWDKKISVENSENDRYIAIYNIFGQFGYIFYLEITEVILEFDRKEYHSEQSKFPICFFSIEQKTIYF